MKVLVKVVEREHLFGLRDLQSNDQNNKRMF